jgi:Mrp family chromosome partitioning ATPase
LKIKEADSVPKAAAAPAAAPEPAQVDATPEAPAAAPEPAQVDATPEAPAAAPEPAQVQYKRISLDNLPLSKRQRALAHLVQEQCRSFCLSLFFGEDPVRSLGITSSIAGEGKSFVAAMMAQVLAQDSARPVLLIECNWEHTGLDGYLEYPPSPGIAEWLRGECTEQDVRYQIEKNLTYIPAGNDQGEAMVLLQKLKSVGLKDAFAQNDEHILIELPHIVSSTYGRFAARLVEAIALVVRAGVTPDYLIAEACSYLSKLPVEGIILNQVQGHYKLRRSARKRG